MKRTLVMTLAAWVQMVSTAAGEGPKLVVPPQVQAQPSEPFRVELETDCKWVRWTIPPGLTRVPPAWTSSGEKAFVGFGPEGVYEFKVEGTLQDVYREGKCVVFIGRPRPDPGPGPAPVPPGDPLLADLQDLYRKDESPQKPAQRISLSRLYRSAADFAKNDATLETVGQLFNKLKLAGDLMVGKGNLLALRERLKVEHAKVFPHAEGAPLDESLRDKASAYFARIADVLDSLK